MRTLNQTPFSPEAYSLLKEMSLAEFEILLTAHCPVTVTEKRISLAAV